jgi:hypothetical protein
MTLNRLPFICSTLAAVAWGSIASAEPVDQAAAGGGAASARSVAIFILSGEEVGTPISELYGAARRGIETETALDVAPFEVFPAELRENAIRQCAGDGGCFAERTRQAGVDVDLLLLVSANRIGDGVLLGLRLVDLRITQGKPDIAAIGEQLPEGASLLRAMKDYLGSVFPPNIWGQVANLRVEPDQENAEVLVGPRACVSPCKIERMTPGTYDVVIRKSGYQEWRGSVTLKPRQDEVVTAALIAEEGGVISSPFFWGAVGLGAAAIAVGAILLFRPADGPFTICIAQSEDQCDG